MYANLIKFVRFRTPGFLENGMSVLGSGQYPDTRRYSKLQKLYLTQQEKKRFLKRVSRNGSNDFYKNLYYCHTRQYLQLLFLQHL